MAKYKIIPSSRTIVQSPISIGHKAEKGVEAIEFDLTAWVETYGSGTLTVIMRRWGDAIPYPIALEIDENNKATWTLSDTDTAKAGMAYAQLSYIVGETVVKKSDIYTFRVMDSLTGEGEPPEAYESWLETLTHLAAEAMAEVLDIEGAVTDKTLTIDGGIADAKATGDALSALEDQFSEETDKLKADLGDITDNIILRKNIASTVTGGKHATNVSGVITISDDSNRGYVKIPVVGGKKYAINIAYSANFSMWGYVDGSTDRYISKLTVPNDRVVEAPSNATVLYLSNTGWSSSTDLVVMQSEESIIGYTREDYPYNVVSGVSIENFNDPKINRLSDDLGTAENNIEDLKSKNQVLFTDASYVDVVAQWVQGNINAQTGLDFSDSTACKTNGFIKGEGTYTINPKGLKTYINIYNLSGERTSGVNWGTTNINTVTLDSSHQMRVVVKKTNDTDLVPSEVATEITLKTTISRVKQHNSDCIFMCHQGYSYDGRATNNSRIQGYYEAYKRGFDWGETDLEYTSDGVLVCCHESSFDDATTGTNYVIAEHTLAELQACDYYGAQIQTLEQVLTVCKKLGMGLGIDQLTSAMVDDVYSIAKKLSMLNHIGWFVTVGASGLASAILAKDEKATLFVLSSTATLAEHIAFANGLCNGKNKVYAYPPYSVGTPQEFATASADLHRDAYFAVWTIDNADIAISYVPYVSAIASNVLSYDSLYDYIVE